MDKNVSGEQDQLGSEPTGATRLADFLSPLGDAAAGMRGNRASFQVNVESPGPQDVVITYANGHSEARSATLWVDGGTPRKIDFPPTGSWGAHFPLIVRLDLPSGQRELSVSALNDAGPLVAGITIHQAQPTGATGSVADEVSTIGASMAAIAAIAVTGNPLPAQAGGVGHSADASPLEPEAEASSFVQHAYDRIVHPAIRSNSGLIEVGSSLSQSKTASDEGAVVASVQAQPVSELSLVDGQQFVPEQHESAPSAAPEAAPLTLMNTSDIAAADETPAIDDEMPQENIVNLPLRLQAESATLGNRGGGSLGSSPTIVNGSATSDTDLENAGAASGGAYVDFAGLGGNFNAGSGEYIEWTFTVDAAGYYDLAFGYAFFSGGASNRPMRLDVNGAIWDRIFDFANTGANTTYSEAITRVYLEAGANAVRLTANGFSGPNLDYLEVRAANPDKIVIQAENLLPAAAATAPTTVNRPITLDYLEAKPTAEQFRVGAEGDAYLDWAGGTAQQRLAVPVTVAKAGQYSITITYANGGGAARPIALLSDNGEVLGTFNFAPTTAPVAYPDFYEDIQDNVRPPDGADAGTDPDPIGFEGWTKETLTVNVTLAAGLNTLTLSGNNGPNIDKIEFNLVEASAPINTNSAPTAADTTATTDEDSAVTIDVASLIADADADTLSVTATVPAAQGTVTVTGTEIIFNPADDFHGEATITYVVSDGVATATASIAVAVSSVNDAPTLSGALAPQELPAAGGTIELTLVAADIDGDSTSLGVRLAGGAALPAGISIVNGALSVAEDVPAGTYALEIFATDGTVQSNAVSLSLSKAEVAPEPQPFAPLVLQAEDGVVVDQIDNTGRPGNDTQIRDDSNPEDPSGKELDANGLRPGSTGSGYVDFGLDTGSAGDSLTLSLNVPVAGTYALHFRYANGGTAPRPLTLSVNGTDTASPLNFAHAVGQTDPWSHWMLQTVTVDLAGGTNSVRLSIASNSLNGPNVDAVAVTLPGQTPSFFLPVITSAASASVAENTFAVLDIEATDGDGATLTYALTEGGADNALFLIDTATGALSFKAAPDLEALAGDDTFSVEVSVTDGVSTVTQTVSVVVSDVNEAPGALTIDGTLSLAESATAGTVVGSVATTDPDGDALTYAVDDARFVVNASRQIVVAQDAAFDFETEQSIVLTLTASDGELSSIQKVTVAVTDVSEQVAPKPVLFDAATLTAYSTQDRGAGASVSADGANLNLNGNLWKRAPLDGDYTIVDGTKLVASITVGAVLPEIIAIGFDDDNSPFEMADQSVYQVGGSQVQAGFVDLRNASATPGQTIQVVIDLSAHAGKTISSLVFVADDDYSGDGVGSVSFGNVQLLQGDAAGEFNNAPEVLAGGIADLVLPERGPLEIDLPFVDRDSDTLTYTVAVTDAQGNIVSGFGGLQVVQGTLVGNLDVPPGSYTVTVTASDGRAEVADSFQLTVADINDVPLVDATIAFEPYFGKVGQEIDGIDLVLFADAFSDADGDQLVLSVEGLPPGLSVNAEGVIVGTPTASTTSITIVATDPHGARATLELPFLIEGPAVGDVTTLEAEAFTGLGEATGFYAAAAPGASGDQAIRTNPSQAGSVATNLGQNGIAEGWYQISITVYDENDGSARFTFKVGDTVLADNLTFDDNGTFDNPNLLRGNAGQVGNLKTITFSTPVFVGAETVAQINGQSDAGEYLRIDKLTFTRVEAPELPPSAITLDSSVVAENAAGAVIGTLSATDPDGDPPVLVYSTTDTRFAITGNQLRLADGTSLDHEVGETVTVNVTATDSQGLATTTDLTITVGDINEAPVLAPAADVADLTLAAGTAGSMDLAALAFTDPDAQTELTLVVRLADGAVLPAGFTLADGKLQVAATVPAGVYELEVFANDGELDSESVSFTVTVAEPGSEPEEPFTLLIQAESGTVTSFDTDANNTDTAIRNADNPESGTNPSLINGLRPGFTGTGYLDYGDTAGDRAAYTFDVPAAGVYEIKVRYATNSARPLDLVVNGAAPVLMAFAATGTNTQGPTEGFNNWAFETITVALQAGSNTLVFAIPPGAATGPNLDSIEITSVLSTDNSADEDSNLFLSGPDSVLTGANKESINFNIAGRDADIAKVEISFDGGTTRTTVLPDADGDFVVNGSALAAGDYQAIVYVTDEAGNVASASMAIEVGGTAEPPFSMQVEGETFTPIDTTGTGNQITQARTPSNQEPNQPLEGDLNGDGLWDGFTGDGYLDMGAQIGDAASFTFDAPSAGTYTFAFRYSNGGGGTNGDRPMTLSVGGQVVDTVSFPGTGVNGWDTWSVATVEVELAAGPQTITLANTVANGPNIDNVTVSRDGEIDTVDPREQIRFEEIIKVNFQPAPSAGQFGVPAGYQTPTGYVADVGAGFGDRGDGFSFGWVDVENGAVTSTPTAQPTGSMRYKNDVPEASDLQKTYAHFEYPGASAATNERAWEMALEDGTYQVTMSIGDTGGAYDSNYVINVEGQSFMPTFTPENLEGQSPVGGAYSSAEDGEGFRSTLVTGIVTVTDGRLTVDSIGGYNTEIQYLEIEKIPDLTPEDGRTADLDFSLFAAPMAASLDGQVPITIGEDGSLPTGIDPSSSFVVAVQLQAEGNRGPNIAHVENVKLVETLTGIEVAIDVQISGGADSLTIRPLGQLKENTSYTLKVQDVMDLGSITDPNGALRQFQDLTTSFVTGEAQEDVPREVAFSTQTLLDGFADGAGGYTSIEFGPDGKLYVATITGEVHRWDVNPDGSINKSSQQTLTLDYLLEADGDRRGIVGFVFDPDEPNTIWISDNAPIPREAKAFDTPEFSGRISKIILGENGSFVGATAETYITGLPRSGGDHLTNSLEFRDNPNAGQPGEPDHLLYLSQGSNSAAGAPDDAWGARPERLLNAAILEIDPTRDAPAGGFDVRTEPVSSTDDPKKTFPTGEFNADGTYPGSYSPFTADAVLKIYATGVRNAYDLVWHSNGNLYVPTNGTASGGKTPNDPTQSGLDTVISNSPKQYDYFFTVDEGGYYGHPNVLRDEYVLNGGNPTAGLDPNEVVGGNDGNSRTDGYQAGVRPDGSYDLDGVYNLGYNRSPNGATEYTGNAFGSNLKGAILFAQFSTGDNVRVIKVDAEGKIIGDDVLRRPDGSVIDDYIDPLDIIQNPVTGQLYLMTLNRGTGASQLILLTPAPGGVTADITADEGNNLSLVAFDVSDPLAAVFQVNGLDSDITAIRVSFNNGPETTVTLDAQNRFTINLDGLSGAVTARIRVTDDALNQAAATVQFTPGEDPTTPEYVTLVTLQAEDRTPSDGTSVTVPTGSNAEIQIRDASNPETGSGVNGPGYVDALRPGAFGADGNTDNLDGTPGGYADFGSTNADYLTFTFSADSAGSAILRFRYANGSAADRPLQLEVNGTIVKVQSFTPTATAPTDGWTVWAEVEIPVTLAAGQNTVTLRSVSATGPNIDQLVVLVPAADETVPNDGELVVDGVTYVRYEAENAELSGAPAVVNEDRDQSGGFVDFIGPDSENITWTVDVGAAGTYGVDIFYALGAGKTARPMTISVNGQLIQTLPFAANSNAAETLWGPQSATLQLAAGVNTITLTAPGGVGPNVDQLRITKEPVAVFEPDYTDISGSGRIELETQDGSAHTVNGSTVEFFFTVGADGVYKLDTAANSNAANGQGLTWFLNGVEVDQSAFPGVGDTGEQSVYLELEAGTQYRVRIVSDAPGASALDYLDVSPAPGNANADIAVQSLDPAYLDNRLHFSYLEDPDAVAPSDVDRDFKDSGAVRITNTGTEQLTFTDFELTGPFVLANPAIFNGLSLAAGQSIDVTVLFNRAAYIPPSSNVDATSTVFQGALKLITNDADDPVTTIDLAGFWQARDEGGQEPNVNEVWKIFGFGNVIEGLTTRGGGENSTLSTKDVFAQTDATEVLSPYWKLADGVIEARITHIAAFHGTGGATIHLHNPGNKGQNVQLWNHEGTDNQRLLPNAGNDANFATRTFNNGTIPDGWAGNEVFGISVAGLSTDPKLNPTGGEVVPGAQQGHTVKMFQALDAEGNVIPDVYLGIMDYTGINYDYNDNMFVIEGVMPVGFGQDMRVSGLDDAAADDRLVFTNIEEPANTQQVFRNEATFTIVNDGFAPLNISSIAVGDPSAFEIVGTPPTSIAAGSSAQITVRFIGTHSGSDAGADLITSKLTITSDDFADGIKVIQLAGLAQEFSERNSEPTVAQIVEAFGYSTDIAQGELAGGGLVETIGDEVLLPYLQRLDGSRPVEVIQLAAFLNQGNVARLGFHGLNSSSVTNLFANDDQQGQTILPDQLLAGTGAGANVARGTINQNGPFGLYISVDGRPTYSSWSDPEANKIDPNFGQLVGDDQGHLIRYFQALDAAGNVIEGTYIGIQDYPGAGNYDYNDHMFVIKNVKAYELTTANDANNDGINDALQLDADNDGTVNFFDANTTPPQPTGQQPLSGTPFLVDADGVTIDASNYDNGGQGVAYNDQAGLQGGTNGGRAGSAVEQTSAGDIGWTAAGEWLEYTINVQTAGSYNIGMLLSNGGTGTHAARIDFFDPDEASPYATATVQNAPTGTWTNFLNRPANNIDLEAGEQIVRITFPTGGHDFRSFTLTPNITQTPFGGIAPTFSNGTLTVDASNFDNGGQGVAYNDNAGLDGGNSAFRPGRDVEMVGGENDIGFVKPGEWIEYTINAPAAGTYGFSVNAKTPVAGATIAVTEAGGATLGVINLADGHAGGSNFGSAAFAQSQFVPITLAAGVQTIRLAFDGPLASNGYVLDLRSFTLTAQNLQTPAHGTAPVLGSSALTIEAIDYDNGGQGVAYNDQAGLQGGTNGGRAGSSVEVTSGGDVGWIANGEWLEYTINVAEAGTYNLNLSMSLGEAGGPNRSVTATFTNGADVETVTLATPRTGSWTNFQNTQTAAVDLEAGTTVVRLTFNGGAQDISSLSLTPEPAMAAPAGADISALFFASEASPGWEDEQPVTESAPASWDDDSDQPSGLAHVFGYDLNA